MLDAPIRRAIDPALDAIGAAVARRGITANQVTVAGGVVGGLACLAVMADWLVLALFLLALNRLADGIDGAVARAHAARHDGAKPTDFGGYLDIVVDFLFYGAFVFAFAVRDPSAALAAAFLILAFVATGTTFLAYAILAAKQGVGAPSGHKNKALHYIGGLTEGTETLALFVAILLVPDWFGPLAWAFGTLCWITAATRIQAAWDHYGRPPGGEAT